LIQILPSEIKVKKMMSQKVKSSEDPVLKKFPFVVLAPGEYEYKGNQGRLLENLNVTAKELFCGSCGIPMLTAVDLVSFSD
jgi:hypothetical protein